MTSAPAHGIGGRADLPLPGEVVLQAGGFVVLVSFLVVALLWREPKFSSTDAPGRPLPPFVQRTADSPAVRMTLRVLALALLAYLVVVAFVGSPDPDVNPAPRALYVLAWVGVVPASLLLGPVWRVLNPLRALYAAARLCTPKPSTPKPSRVVSERVGYWPAAAALAVFVWLELVPADRAEPVVVGLFLVGYVVVVTGGAVLFGEQWFSRGDPFEVYSTLVAGLAPFGRRPDGVLAWRNPLRGLAGTHPANGLVAVLAVWWGSTVFDGVSGTTWWANTTQQAGVDAGLLATAALVALAAVVGLSYRLATGAMANPLVSTLVPIAVGYTIAHYVSLLLTEGPRGLAQLVGAQASPPAPHPMLIAAIQVAAILVGHVAGVVAAHDRVLALASSLNTAPITAPAQRDEHDSARRLAEQIPLVMVMIVYTMIGLYLLVVA